MIGWECDKCGRKIADAKLPVRCLCGQLDYGSRSERHAEVAALVARTARLISWLRFFRHPSDRGVGDTATRLLTSTQPATDARRELERLLAKCSCSRVDAVERLNQQWPY
jgi:hypothetical protein